MDTTCQLDDKQDIYNRLIVDLASGQIRPGERLGEERLATRWGVGRSVVREAMMRLEQDGLVERKPRSGSFMREINDDELLEIYDVRAAVEGLIARRVAEHFADSRYGDEQIDQLGQLADLTDSISDENEQRASRDFDFHRALCDLSGLTYVKRVLRIANLHVQCSWFNQRVVLLRGFLKQEVLKPNHGAIVETLKQGNPDDAEQIMRGHLYAAKEAMIRDIERIQSQLDSVRQSVPEGV